MAEVKKTVYLTKFFNNRANPYGDFDSATYDVAKLEDVAKTPEELHEAMRADDIVCGYQTYEIHTCEHDGVVMTSEPVNHSVKTIFGSVRHVRDIKIIKGYGSEGKIRKPYLEEFPHVNPDSVYISGDGGGMTQILEPETANVVVFDRATNKQIWPKLSNG
ncbi:MAG: hypothetical protein VXW91_03695 [Pseudomonadota bacterium]|nr:hypothetical protein [Pseudomonadota bacterium]MEC8665787.1 hypothetical protein [Pseudomonadota bacterium]